MTGRSPGRSRGPSLAALAGAFALAAAASCGPSSEQAPTPPVAKPAEAPPAPAEASRAEAEQAFASRCADCHGVRGAGNGPKSGDFEPLPRNFQDPEWQREASDEYIEKIMVEGGAAVGKSDKMPADADLAGRPELVKALRAYVRSLEAR